MRLTIALGFLLAQLAAPAAVHYINARATNENRFTIEVTTTTSPQDFILRIGDPSSFNVAWGDGTTNTYTYSSYATQTHSYAAAGVHTIRMWGHAHWIDFFVWPDPGSGTPELITKVVTPIWGIDGLVDCTEMWKHCHSLTYFPTNLYDYVTNVTTFYDLMIECNNVTNLPPGFFRHQTNVTSMYAVCDQMEKLLAVDEDLFDSATNNLNLGWAFAKCYDLKSIPANLYRTQTKVTTSDYIHYRNYDLTNLPPLLFNTCTSIATLANGFYQCTNLLGHTPTNSAGQKLWEITPAITGTACFYQCTNLSDYASIPAGWK